MISIYRLSRSIPFEVRDEELEWLRDKGIIGRVGK